MKGAKEVDKDKPKFNVGTLLNIRTLTFEDVTQQVNPNATSNELAKQVKTDFTEDNISQIQENGGCEFLFKSYMVDVTAARQREGGHLKEISMRVRYLKWLKGGKDQWISVGGGGKKKGAYMFGRVEVDVKNADKRFEVVAKKKVKKKSKAAKVAEESGLAVVVPKPPSEEKKEMSSGDSQSALVQSPLVARLQKSIN